MRGYTESRERAKALVLSGGVMVDGVKIDNAGAKVHSNAEIVLLKSPLLYVSRGGLKLAGAIEHFNIEVREKIAIDVGASTGGFTDCLLKKGAARVYAVDVGYGQLAWTLRQDPRVVVLERRNIRHLQKEAIPEQVDLITIDVSFISLEKVIPVVQSWLKTDGALIALIKPQFEVGKDALGKGGIVRDAKQREEVVGRIIDKGIEWGLKKQGVIQSPIKGQKGNVEIFVYFQPRLDQSFLK